MNGNRFSEEFAPTEVKNVALQFHGDTNENIKFPCVGGISGETVLRELIRRCAGVEVGKKVKPEKGDLNLTGHVPIKIFRKIYGLSNEGLKAGVYSYNTSAKGAEFTLTADVIDEFGETTKMIAFPRVVSATGLRFNVQNGEDEVAEVELDFTAYPDGPKNDIYYEGFVDEVEDVEVKEKWHTNFNFDLVKKEEVPTP